MDTVSFPNSPERMEIFENSEGKFFRSFLISTKENDANWKILRNTGHEKVKSALNRDFAIIPELIQKPINEGGGGHYKGSREQILKAYADNSHGKIVKLLGPFYYPDSPEDYWYDQITKLSNSRSASVLHQEGQKTWNGYDVSPHIFVNKGSDAKGWEDWEFAGLNLVIRGAFGPQAIITKFCDGSEAKCFKDLVASSTNTNDETTAELITSYLSKFASTPHSMTNDANVNKPDSNMPSSASPQIPKTNTTTDPQKGLTDAPTITSPTEVVTISRQELEAMKKSITDSDNERKEEILGNLFAHISDEKEREKEVKEYSKLNLDTVKMLKKYTEKITPAIHEKAKAELKKESKERERDEDEDESGGGGNESTKKAKPKEKERSASTSSSGLDKEPKIKFHSPNSDNNSNSNDESREASVPEVRNEVWALRQKLLRGRRTD